MVDEQNGQVIIEHFSRVDSVSLEPMVEAFQDSGISARVLRKPDESQGTQLLWLALMPPLVKLLVTTAASALFREAAKDGYSALKRGFGALWRNLRDASDPGFSNRYSMKLSLVREFDDGRQLRLLLDPDSQPRDAETAFALFIDAVKQIGARGGQTVVVTGGKLELLFDPDFERVEILVFNPRLNRLERIEPGAD